MSDQANWMDINDKHLTATVEWIRLRLLQLAALPEDSIADDSRSAHGSLRQRKTTTREDLPSISSVQTAEALEIADQKIGEYEQNDPPPTLILLAKSLGLSKFDRDVLALCAAMELPIRHLHWHLRYSMTPTGIHCLHTLRCDIGGYWRSTSQAPNR
jgi:hypothetical protein